MKNWNFTAIETAVKGLFTILHNGKQFDIVVRSTKTLTNGTRFIYYRGQVVELLSADDALVQSVQECITIMKNAKVARAVVNIPLWKKLKNEYKAKKENAIKTYGHERYYKTYDELRGVKYNCSNFTFLPIKE